MSIVHDELIRIYHRDGELTPQAVVAEAEPEDSLLHPYFEWDDQAAGEKYRVIQAEQLIRKVKIEIVTPENRTIQVRRFVSTGDYQYQDTEKALHDPQMRDLVFEQAKRELRNLQLKYQALVDFDAVIQAVQDDGAA